MSFAKRPARLLTARFPPPRRESEVGPILRDLPHVSLLYIRRLIKDSLPDFSMADPGDTVDDGYGIIFRIFLAA